MMNIIRTSPQFMAAKWIVVGMVVVAAGLFGFISGWKLSGERVRAQWAQESKRVAEQHLKALQAAIAFNEEIRSAQEEFNKGVLSNYETNIADLQRSSRRLRISASVCREALAAGVGSAEGTDGAAATTVLLPERNSESLDGIAKRAEVEAEKLRNLQRWVDAHECRLKTAG